MSAGSVVRWGLRPAVVLVGYWALSRAALQLVDPHSYTTVMYPAIGFAVGLTVTAPRRQWPWLILAVLLGNWTAESQFRGVHLVPTALSAIDAIEVLIVSTVIWRVSGDGALRRNSLRRVAGLCAGMLAVLPTALLGALVLVSAYPQPLGREIISWFFSDTTGIAVLAPISVAVAFAARRHWPSGESVATTAVTLGLATLVFCVSEVVRLPVIGYVVLLLPLIWAAVRLGEVMMALSIVLFASVAAAATAHGLGPFALVGHPLNDRLIQLQVYILVLSTVTVAISALMAELVTATRGLARERETLAAALRAERAAQTALVSSETAQRDLAQRMETLLNAAGDALIGVDLDGLITFVNEAAERQTGYPAAAMLGRHSHDLLHHSHPDGSPYAREDCQIATIIGTGASVRGEGEVFWRADHSAYPVEFSCQPLRSDDALIGAVITVADITERTRSRQRLEAAEQRFRDAFAGAPVPMAMVSLAGAVIDANAAMAEFLGRDRGELIGRDVAAIAHPSDIEVCRRAMSALVTEGTDIAGLELRFLTGTERVVIGRMQGTAIRDEQGTAEHLILHVLDLSERRAIEARLEHLTDHDELTGLYNRRRFEIELELALAGDTALPAAVIVLDLDHFKEVNDTVGHARADRVLTDVGAVLRERAGQNVIARLGADAFAVLLAGTDELEAELTAAALTSAIRERIVIPEGDRERSLTASAGVAGIDNAAGHSVDGILNDAEFAMYDAKEAGANRTVVFDPAEASLSRTRSRMAWVRRIERAIDDSRFVLLAQPILDLGQGAVTRVELLLRMVAEDGGLIGPGAFLPVAERHGLITRLDRWVVSEAIRLLEQTHADGIACHFEINLSGRSIGDPTLLDAITAQLREVSFDPASLIFEITETAAVADIVRARRFADDLRSLGCRFALDDFGAGFGSFYYLKHLPFDYLKIDGEFVNGCVADRTDQLVLASVVQVARGLGTQTIAEFVGDAETLAMVRQLGVDFAQGAHISMPIPLADALALTGRPWSDGLVA